MIYKLTALSNNTKTRIFRNTLKEIMLIANEMMKDSQITSIKISKMKEIKII